MLICSAVCLFSLLVVTVFAHPGRTDSKGGHTNHSTGEYHYHHGYSAHDHYDMDGDGTVDCPYDFDDQTNHSNSGTTSPEPTAEVNSSKNNTKSNTDFRSVLVWIISIGIYVFLMFVLPFLITR